MSAADPDAGNVGLAHGIQPPPAPDDHVQHSVSYRLDYATGDLVAYGPDGGPRP